MLFKSQILNVNIFAKATKKMRIFQQLNKYKKDIKTTEMFLQNHRTLISKK